MARDKYKELTSQGASAYFTTLEKIGWFELPQNDRVIVKKKLEQEEDDNKLLFAIPHLVIDVEGFEDVSDYVSLLNELLLFTGINATISTKPGDKKNTISIGVFHDETLNIYDLNLDKANGWLNQNFIEDFVNEEILKGNNNQFFAMPPEDQSVPFVFIPESLYKQAKKVGIIPTKMGYFMT